MNELTLFIVILMTFLAAVRSDEVLGCGGFLKSHVPIDYSKVEIKLITKQGTVKDKTTAAPNNGYYFVPLYDKGDMLLELSPPPGWSFEPKSVALSIDGETDLCSQGKDINFVFQGFGITGKIEVLGMQFENSGPAGVTVKLESDGEVRTTVSDKAGNFFFTPVYPRKYKLTISHPKWKIYKETVEVTVAEGNTELPRDSLVIQGFDVSGQVKSEGESVKDTMIVILSKEKGIVIQGCSKEPISELNVEDNIICHVKTNEDGKFVFETVPNGNYYVIPYYRSQNIYFKPDKIEFTVNNKELELTESFEIIGFSISGKVIKSKGVPLPNAKVFVNGQETTKTDANGVYTLEKIKAGNYNIRAESENLVFDEVRIRVDLSLIDLPDIQPSAFKICGMVTSDHSQEVTFAKVGSTTILQTLSAQDGHFCEFLSPGKYEITVVVSDRNKERGLQFYPLVQTIEVNSEKVPNIVFSQLKSTISGKVQCLVPGECDDITVVMKTGNENEVTFKVKGGSYSVGDMYPGTYEIRLLSNKFCWETDTQTIIVDSEKVEVPKFVQKGYTVIFASSHNTQINFKLPGQTRQTSFKIQKGRSNFCLEKSGEYLFNLESCHGYAQDTIQYKTNAEVNEIILTATKHTLKLGIQTDADYGSLQVSVKVGTEKSIKDLSYSGGMYAVDMLLEPGESAVVVPQSDVLFFTPPILSVEGGDDCEYLGVKFVAVKGKLFEGKVIPPLDGVIITVESTDSEKLVIETDQKGAFKFPPLDSKKDYKISAVKESYILTGPDKDGNFLAHKLAEVVVDVTDIANNRSLSGVLLSLSGGESYRKNLQSNEAGRISFTSLSPGEYFLRPMMKEYQFEPSSKIIQVQEGQTVNVHLTAKRVAYSAYGQVVSLNGEPEVDMVVVAQGKGNCSEYSEDTTCETTGHFRIRGLQPYCSYNVVVKEGLNNNIVVERSAPEYIEIDSIKEDIRDLKLVVFHPASQMDVLVKIFAENIEHYKFLKVKLLREFGSPALLHVAKIDSLTARITKSNNPGILVHFPSIPIDRKPYSVMLDSGLPTTKEQVQYFNSNQSFKFVEFNFGLKDNISEQQIKQTSSWSLVFIFAVLVAAYNIDLIGNFLNEKFNLNLSTLISMIPMPVSTPKTPTDYYDDAQIDQIVQSINSAKKKPKPKKI